VSSPPTSILMRDDFATAYFTEMRFEMRLAMAMPRKVTKPKADLYRRLSEAAVRRAHQLSRPGYLDAPGFADDRWLARGQKQVFTTRQQASSCGREKVYGWSSRPFWREMWKAVKYAFLSAIAEETGATYETTEGGRSFAIVTGLTA
jgi:hypothetical protein